MRLSKEELQAIKNKHGVETLWSFSRFDKYRTSHYEYFLDYILKKPYDAPTESAYGELGGIVHDIIEKMYHGEIELSEAREEFENLFTCQIDVLDLKFDRTSSDKNTSIKNKYYVNVLEFFKNYNMLPYDLVTEEFVDIEVAPGIAFQGYIDAQFVDDDGIHTIVDWKTSTKYTGSAVDEHSHQLLLYAEGLRQRGIPADKIKAGWCFVKYVQIECENVGRDKKTGEKKFTTVTAERGKIGEKLQNKAKTWLKKEDLTDEEIEEILNELYESNSLDCLPEAVREKFSIHDCYVWLEDIWDKYEELRINIINTVHEIEDKVADYNITGDERIWWDSDEMIQKQVYYFNNLSDYSIKSLKPYAQYLDRLKKEKEDPFALNNNTESSEEPVDLSWLDML